MSLLSCLRTAVMDVPSYKGFLGDKTEAISVSGHDKLDAL
jgi:hypothetical protein